MTDIISLTGNMMNNTMSVCENKKDHVHKCIECKVCYDNIEDGNYIELKCSHAYHSDCILMSYQMKTDRFRECPYCRKDGGYLPLLDGQTPIKNIHREWLIENKNYGYYGRCIGVLKSGKNKGKQCTCKANGTDKYCGRHRPK